MATNDEHQSKKLKTESDSYGSQSGVGFVTITVGTGESKITRQIHKGLLCSKVDYFKKMFESGFKEGIEQVATFPEDDPVAFD